MLYDGTYRSKAAPIIEFLGLVDELNVRIAMLSMSCFKSANKDKYINTQTILMDISAYIAAPGNRNTSINIEKHRSYFMLMMSYYNSSV